MLSIINPFLNHNDFLSLLCLSWYFICLSDLSSTIYLLLWWNMCYVLHAEMWNDCSWNVEWVAYRNMAWVHAEMWNDWKLKSGVVAYRNMAWVHAEMWHVHMLTCGISGAGNCALYWHHPAAGLLKEIYKFPASGHINRISCGRHISGICPEEGNSIFFAVLAIYF